MDISLEYQSSLILGIGIVYAVKRIQPSLEKMIGMPKTRKPVADYITFEQYQKMLKDEPEEMYRLLFRFMHTFWLRVSEAVGQNKSDVDQIKRTRQEREQLVDGILKDSRKLKRYRDNHYGKVPKVGRRKWVSPTPGIRVCDIDSVSASSQRLQSRHTLSIYRKMGKFEVLPFNDEQLYRDCQNYIKKAGLKGQDRLFPIWRSAVLVHMNQYGSTVGGMTKIHPHSLRRAGGIYARDVLNLPIEVIQVGMSHESPSQTMAYLTRDKSEAMNAWAKAQAKKV